MPTSRLRNLDRRGDPRDEIDHDHYTQWLLDELGSDLIELWPLGEQPGATDFVGAKAGKSATINGTWTLGNTPIAYDAGDAAQPDGSTGYADVGDDADFDFGDNDSLTVGAWVQISGSLSSFKRIASKRDPSSLQGWDFVIRGDETPQWLVDDGSDNKKFISGTDVTDGVPHFLAGTWDGASGNLYVDGTSDASGSNSSVGSLKTDDPMTIAVFSDESTSFFPGLLSHVFVCSAVLSATTIERIYQRGVI